MDGKATEVLLKVNCDYLLPLIFGGGSIECETTLPGRYGRTGDGVGFDCDVAILAKVRAFHDFHTAAGKVGAIALFHTEAESSIKRLTHK